MTTFTTGNPIIDFFYILFNGISEVPLISSAITGILILAGTTLASRRASIMMITSGLTGSAVAIILGADYNMVTMGLFGYNSILSGMAFWSGPFSKSSRTTFVYSIFVAAITAIILMSVTHLLRDLFVIDGKGTAIPALTSAFVFTTWFLMFAGQRIRLGIGLRTAEIDYEYVLKSQGKIERVEKPKPNEPSSNWTVAEFFKSTLNGVSQITFISNWKTGIFWVVGLSLSFEIAPVLAGNPSNWWSNAYSSSSNPLFLAGAMALWGSGIGLAVSVLMKVPNSESKSGVHGFNPVLVMIALTSFLPLSLITFLYATFAAISSCFVTYFLQNYLSKWGLPTLTGPFVFTTWGFIMAVYGFHNIPAGVGWARP
ncbi:MAG: urea transporter [Thaumarchaeota archaeon]|nr:urea transporter [Nitrososphaerota archaeon]